MQPERLLGPLHSKPRIFCRFLRAPEGLKDIQEEQRRLIVVGLNLHRAKVMLRGPLEVALGDAKLGV